MKQGVLYTAAAGVLMALLVFAGCSGPFDREAAADADEQGMAVLQFGDASARPVEPGISAELAPAQVRGGRGNVVKMVPFRGSGTYQYVEFLPDFVEEQIEIVVALEGTVTRLGRFQAVETYHFKFMMVDGHLVPYEYLSHSSIYTAANGDELHIEGCVDEHGSVLRWYADDTGTGFSLTGVQIAGGTGRFENAEGGYDFWINKSAPSDPGGTWEFEGEISSVGSSK